MKQYFGDLEGFSSTFKVLQDKLIKHKKDAAGPSYLRRQVSPKDNAANLQPGHYKAAALALSMPR